MARRLWTPADMVGLANHEYTDTTKGITTADGTLAAGSIVTRQDYQLIGSGTPDYISAFRDDFRPVLDAINGQQAIKWDTATRQMDISKTNLPQGDGDKFWWTVDVIDETRTDDRYIWGYGGSNGSSVAYKMRQGAVPYSDIGSVGYAIGTTPVKAGELSIITEQYTKANTTSKASYNGGAWSSYNRARNTNISNAARYGHWAVYGNGSAHRSRFRGHGYGTPTEEDWQRLRGWASWAAGANGANLVDGHPYKDAPPYIDDGTGGATAAGGAALAGTTVTAAGAATLTGTAAVTLPPVAISGAAGSAASAMLTAALAPMVITGLARANSAAAGSPALAASIGAGAGSSSPIVGAQGVVSLGAVAVVAAGGVTAAAAGGAQLALLAGSGVCGVATRGAATAALYPIVPAGAAGAVIVGSAAAMLAPIQLVGRAAGVTTGSGGTNLGAIAGAGMGSPPSPAIVVPAARQMILTTAGSRRLTLSASGSRHLTI